MFAIVDPTSPSLEDLSFLTGCSINFVVVELGQLHELLDSVRTPSEEIDMDMDLGEEFEALEISAYEDTSEEVPDLSAH